MTPASVCLFSTEHGSLLCCLNGCLMLSFKLKEWTRQRSIRSVAWETTGSSPSNSERLPPALERNRAMPMPSDNSSVGSSSVSECSTLRDSLVLCSTYHTLLYMILPQKTSLCRSLTTLLWCALGRHRVSTLLSSTVPQSTFLYFTLLCSILASVF